MHPADINYYCIPLLVIIWSLAVISLINKRQYTDQELYPALFR